MPDKTPNYRIDKDMAWQNVKANINRKATQAERNKMAQNIKKTEIDEVIRISKKGKAAGIDGLPTELYQMLQNLHKDKVNPGDKIPNIVEVLTSVFNEIEKFGTVPKTEFTEGWMRPIYKKKERNNIATYRPITVLNFDYNIFTKALTIRLTEAAPGLIHEGQAGFMKGRSFFNHIHLAEIVIDWAEATEEDGVIVALDQEKAYNKINHEYLWIVLEEFKLLGTSYAQSKLSTLRQKW
ncbi:hypothetical protein D9757_015092 [Collybiopsis confluens]|uniref:Reverse transcriptase domain-containing protein n=1 Tax=Collybiopsis confluens TaxID=2823264 RepID=A0A8H5C9K6_9AGAR|nr:hypothetical protein D9757_015092 [Collybiopsis confluens]